MQKPSSSEAQKQIILNYGITNELALLVSDELTVGKLLSYKNIQERLGYDYHNVHVVRNGEILDFETFVGAEDVVLQIETRASSKGMKGREFRRKLVRLAELKLLRSKGPHDVYVNPDGVQISLPRHDAKEFRDGTLHSILKKTLPGTSLSAFKRSKV